jgi:ATPase subunit of ABC transporter with duplicated ATPase domains
MLTRWPTLSPGERKRWQIGAALYQAPDVLLLDEPTNHLDQEAKYLLIDALQSFDGLGIIVSHDRDILEALTYQTLRCTPGEVTLYTGSYEQARSLWEAEHQRKKNEYHQSQQEEEKRQKILTEKREILQSVEKNRSSKNRMKNNKDHDARGGLMKFKINTAAARIARQVGVANDRAERASSKRADFVWQREVGRSLFVSYEAPPTPWISSLTMPALLAGDTLLLESFSVGLRRGEKIWLRGNNGSGKTTLLHALYKASPLQKERLLYLPQELLEEEQTQLLQKTKQLAPKERGQVLSLLAALGVEPDRVLSSQKPSPGEARKLALAYGLGTCSWALFLDEPTNHLDLPSIERLEEALADFPGAIILISHDEAFAKTCTQLQWEIKDKTLLT